MFNSRNKYGAFGFRWVPDETISSHWSWQRWQYGSDVCIRRSAIDGGRSGGRRSRRYATNTSGGKQNVGKVRCAAPRTSPSTASKSIGVDSSIRESILPVDNRTSREIVMIVHGSDCS